MRRHILEILQDRSMPASERIFRMMDFAETEMPEFTWEQMEDILLGLERLDPAWEEYVRRLSGEMRKDLSGEEWETAFEQLAVYFLYRHFIGVSEDGDVTGRTGFIALSWMIIRRICESCAAENPDFGIDDLVEIARMYSSETEYSEENMDALRNLFAGE